MPSLTVGTDDYSYASGTVAPANARDKCGRLSSGCADADRVWTRRRLPPACRYRFVTARGEIVAGMKAPNAMLLLAGVC